MAPGRKTGGRNFPEGNPGKRKGAKDIVPRTFKASIKRAYEELAQEHPSLFKAAIMRGLRASPPKSFQYLQMGAHYLDGKPADSVKFLDITKLTTETLERILKECGEPV